MDNSFDLMVYKKNYIAKIQSVIEIMKKKYRLKTCHQNIIKFNIKKKNKQKYINVFDTIQKYLIHFFSFKFHELKLM